MTCCVLFFVFAVESFRAAKSEPDFEAGRALRHSAPDSDVVEDMVKVRLDFHGSSSTSERHTHSFPMLTQVLYHVHA